MPAQASSYRGSLLDASRRPAFQAWAKREEASHRAARRDLRDLGARVDAAVDERSGDAL